MQSFFKKKNYFKYPLDLKDANYIVCEKKYDFQKKSELIINHIYTF